MAKIANTIDLGDIVFYIKDVPFNSATNHQFAQTILDELKHRFKSKNLDFQVMFEVQGFSPGCTKIRLKVYLEKFTTGLMIASAILTIGNELGAITKQIHQNFQITSEDHTIKKAITVKKGDKLWVIAQEYKYESCTVEQFMIAIYLKNISAFYKPNINCLSTGRELMLPTTDMIKYLSRDYAKAEVERQNNEYKKMIEGRSNN